MRIGIVNDTPFSVIALKRTLTLHTEHKVIWVATNGAEAVDKCAKDIPDLVLMDLLMPVMDGVEATRRIMAESPCAILVVTASVGTHSAKVFEAMGHGALDAVNTPELGTSTAAMQSAPFLAKLTVLGKLIRDTTRPAPASMRQAAPARNQDRLLAIGSSAGGPGALSTVLQGLPKDFPAAVVIVQHVDEHFAAGMAEWLGQKSGMPVRVARNNDRLETGTVLLAGTEDHLILRGRDHLAYTPEPKDQSYRPSVDVFFHSLCEHFRGQAAGVLLTGMGNDGAQGLKAMRDAGHYTIAQDKATSAVYGMPKAAAQLDAAVDIIGITKVAPKVIEYFGKKR